MKIFACVIITLIMHIQAYALGKQTTQGEIAEGSRGNNSYALSKMGLHGHGSRTSGVSSKPSGGGWRNLFRGGGGGGIASAGKSGVVAPFKATDFNGKPGTVYLEIDGSNYCKAGTLYWYDQKNGWMGCRALNRTTGYSVGAGRFLGTTHSGLMSDGKTPCSYYFGGQERSRIQGGALPKGFSSPIHGTKKSEKKWGPTSAYTLNSMLLIHGRAGLGEAPSLSTLEKNGGASGCVVTSDSCLRSMNNSGTSQKVFKVQ